MWSCGVGQVPGCSMVGPLDCRVGRGSTQLQGLIISAPSPTFECAARSDPGLQHALPRHARGAGEVAAATEVVVNPRAQLHSTDPDARIMKTSDGSFHYCYSAQAVVDEEAQVILATALVQDATDVHQLVPMMEATTEQLARAAIATSPATCSSPSCLVTARRTTSTPPRMDRPTCSSRRVVNNTASGSRSRRGVVFPPTPRHASAWPDDCAPNPDERTTHDARPLSSRCSAK